MKELIQKKTFASKHYKILKGKLQVNIKSTKEQNEWTCSLEELGLKKLYKKQPRFLLNLAVVVCFAIALAAAITYFFFPEQIDAGGFYINTVLWGFLGLFFMLVPVKNEVYLYGGSQDLAFYRNIPNEESVDQFLDELIQATKEYLREKYTKIDKDLAEDIQIENFKWLKDIEVITEQEYQELKEELTRQKLL